MHYPRTVLFLCKRIIDHYPLAQDQLEAANKELFRQGFCQEVQFPAYLLWMLEELQTFTDAAKAGRWMGYVQRALGPGVNLDIVTLQENRDIVRSEVD